MPVAIAGQERSGEASGRLCTGMVLLAAVPLLAWAAIANPDRFNPDAVSYLLLARHWRAGAWDLALSGYWGPLFPWLVALLLPFVPDAIVAGRVVMAGSALLFLWGGMRVLHALQVPRGAWLAGAACLLVFAVAWSVAIMTPDLLVSGLLLSAMASALAPGWRQRPGRQVAAGVLFGLAYYAKAVALPLGFGLLLACVAWQAAHGARWRVAGPAARMAATMLLVAAPWVTALSLNYGKPSIGTSGAINHATAGPPGVAMPGVHPTFSSFHAPRAGRVTTWEEPSELPYAVWSPLSDATALRHQLRIVGGNLAASFATLRGFDALGLGVAALLLAPLAAGVGIRPWQGAILPVAMTVAIYLPVTSNGEPRYLMPAYPFLLAAALGLAGLLAAAGGSWLAVRRGAAALLVALSFLVPLRHDAAIAMLGRPNPALLAAREVAAVVREAGIEGGIASVEELGFAALFAAFLLERPFLGTEATLPERGRLAALGAGVLLVRPGGAADRALAADAAAVRLPLATDAVAAWRVR